ncbi:MAG: hydrogen gas-evolving membrane-bound hydrogenase subunit E [Nitrospinota bacterium]
MADTLLIVFFPFLAAALMPLVERLHRQAIAFYALIAPLLCLLSLIRLYGRWSPQAGRLGGTLRYSLPWVVPGPLPVQLSFLVDGLSLMWGFLVAGMGLLIVLYSHWYMAPGHRAGAESPTPSEPPLESGAQLSGLPARGRVAPEEALGRFYGWLLAFMGSMLGVVLADNLVSLFVFWELTSLTSFFLIGFWSEREASNYGATKAVLITGGGGLALLGGFILLNQGTGSWELSELLAHPRPEAVTPWVFALILLGAATKSAQLPFHIWLPNAMEAPTPVSAFLHSATMVKAGIYLLARFYPLMGGHPWWGYAVPALGMATMIAGGLLALRAHDLKAILAYSTVSQLGLIVTFLGWGGEAAVLGGTLHLLNHAAAKAGLFMLVGIVEHETGTRDVRELGGLRKSMPRTHLLALVLAASLTGIPPLGGFLTKEMLYESSLHTGGAWPYWTLLAGFLTALYHLRLVGVPFWEDRGGRPPKHPHDPPRGMLLAPAALALLAILFGIAPGLIEGSIVEPAASATMGWGRPVEADLALWHGFNLPLLMSALTLALGGAVYLRLAAVEGAVGGAARAWGRGPTFNRIYDGTIRLAVRYSWPSLLLVQHGFLRRYLAWMILAFLVLVGVMGTQLGWRLGSLPGPLRVGFLPAVVCVLLWGAAFATALFRHRLSAILALGLTGYLTAGLYLLLKAPDLALTQIMIESMTVILFLLVFWFLPELHPAPNSTLRRARDWAVAGAMGATVTALTALAMNTRHLGLGTVADYFMQTSYRLAGFKNVVNAVIVDYRGYDTLGEITVLAVAGVAIYALMRLAGGTPARPRSGDPRRPVAWGAPRAGGPAGRRPCAH